MPAAGREELVAAEVTIGARRDPLAHHRLAREPERRELASARSQSSMTARRLAADRHQFAAPRRR